MRPPKPIERKPPASAKTSVPQLRKDAGRALDAQGQVVADEYSADAVRTRAAGER